MEKFDPRSKSAVPMVGSCVVTVPEFDLRLKFRIPMVMDSASGARK